MALLQTGAVQALVRPSRKGAREELPTWGGCSGQAASKRALNAMHAKPTIEGLQKCLPRAKPCL
eukprot:5868674-Pleurochrysis_carterae.AAC.2